MKNKFIKIYRNEQGYSLLIAIFSIVLLSVIGISIFTISGNTMKTSTHERIDQAVYYIAEAGIVERKAMLYSDINKAYLKSVEAYKIQLAENQKKPINEQKSIIFSDIFSNLLNKVPLDSPTYEALEENFEKELVANVNIHKSINEEKKEVIYTLTSTGQIVNAGSTRKVTQKVTVNLDSATLEPSSDKYAIYARNNIQFEYYDIKNNVKGELASATQSEVYFNPPITYAPPIKIKHDTASLDTLINHQFKEKLSISNALNVFNNTTTYYPNNSNLITSNSISFFNDEWNNLHNKKLSLTNNLKLNTFSITNGGLTFTIDVGNSDKILYVDKLTLNGHINIMGTGKLTLVVKNEITFGNTFLNQNGIPDNLNIYYAGSKDLSFTNNTYLNANLFINQANLVYSGGGGFSGTVFSNGTGTITLAGGIYNQSLKFVTPNYDFTLTRGATVKGAIICKNFYLGGDSRIEYLPNTSSGENIILSTPIKSQPITEIN